MQIFFAYIRNYYYLCSKFDAKEVIMTVLQLNADIYSNLATLSGNKLMLDKAAKYIRRLAKQMKDDPTCMSKEEYLAMLDRSEAQYARGEYTTLLPGESVTEMLRRSGYDL